MSALHPVQNIFYLSLELVAITSPSLPALSALILVPIWGSISHILSVTHKSQCDNVKNRSLDIFIWLLHNINDPHYIFSDCLTLQLWRDGREAERGLPNTKGSVNLSEYIGCEHSFNLDKEANTIALIFRAIVVLFAFEEKETLIKWQVIMNWSETLDVNHSN